MKRFVLLPWQYQMPSPQRQKLLHPAPPPWQCQRQPLQRQGFVRQLQML
jgi:hypothetical protein